MSPRRDSVPPCSRASIAADVVRRSFALWRRSERADEVLDKSSGYKAIHMLVLLDKDIELALSGAICEVQVTSIACHAFNELEHDIAYKLKGVAPGVDVQRYTKDAFYAARLLDAMMERLSDGRAREIASSARTIESSEDLRFVLERIIDRPVSGEVERLHRLLSGVLTTVTAHELERLALQRTLADGLATAASHGIDDVDSIIAIALGLLDRFGQVFRELAAQWRGLSTPLKRAILKATEP